MASAASTKHIVIVGGGFAGVGCAQELARSGDVRVTLVDRHNYHQFQPLFYQLATSELTPRDVGFSIRKIFHKTPDVDIKLADVTAIDPKARSVSTKEGEVYQGDFLVLAAGAQANFFNTPGADANSFPLYSLVDAERLRSRILALFEDADRDPKLIEQGALNFVIVGGGATGTEMAGGLADMIHSTLTAEYEDLAVSSARIYLVERGPTLLAPFSAKAHDYASKVLHRGGVILKLNTAVDEVHPGHVVLSDGSTIKTRCVIWAPASRRPPLQAARGCRRDVAAESTCNTILASRASLAYMRWAISPTSQAPTAMPCRSSVLWHCRAADGPQRISWPISRASRAPHSTTTTRASWR